MDCDVEGADAISCQDKDAVVIFEDAKKNFTSSSFGEWDDISISLPETNAFLSELAVLPDLDSRKTSASSLQDGQYDRVRDKQQITDKSIPAHHIAASSKRTSRLCSTSEGFGPISDALTANNGFPVAFATFSRKPSQV